jgi:hypothetical protein
MDGVTARDAACEHPDSRICWSGWIGMPQIDDRYRNVVEQCSECGTALHASALWESEVVR